MNGCFLLVSDVDIDALLADPSQVVDFLDTRVWEPGPSPDYLDIERAFFTEPYESLVALVARGAHQGRGMLVWIA